jgi:Tfp pilus assembly protein PilO
MWRVLVVILVLSLGYWFIVKNSKQKTSVRDRTGDLLTAEHIKDVYNNDILDDEVSRMLVFSG